jgi:low temperature requirement protein LtrA
MIFRGSRANLLRDRDAPESGRVGAIELFFDLVFVFAVTQLSHGLLAHLSMGGGIRIGLLMLAVWWAWVYTVWLTNWLDVETLPVRVMLFALMGTGLVTAMAIPQAFGNRGGVFVGAYLATQIGRSLFAVWALKRHSHGNHRNFWRITLWFIAASPLWIAGAFSVEHRLLFWAAALAIEYAGPSFLFWVPGLGRSTISDWDVEGHHMAERAAGFVIIALGESVLVTGATFAEKVWDGPGIAAFVSAFIGAVAMWWIYFNIGAERGAERITQRDDPGRSARLGYTYLHLPIVAGIIVTAAANELVLDHPLHPASPVVIACIVGGPLLYVAGVAAFKRTSAPNIPLSHQVGSAALLLMLPFAPYIDAVILGAATTAALVLIAIWEAASFRRT